MNKKGKLSMVLCLSLAFFLCLTAHETKAAGIDEITPDGGVEFAIVLQGQSTGSISTTAETPFDILNVALVSVGNTALTASLNMTSGQTGVWWISLVSVGRTVDADFVFGFAPLGGFSAQVAVDPTFGFAWAAGGVISAVPVSAEEPLEYNIVVTGLAQ
jgi:hypothetical protein